MSRQEIVNECTQGKWVPVLVIRANTTQLPLFPTVLLAYKFAKRNLPKSWQCGHVEIQPQYVKWDTITFTFPRKLKNANFDVEVIECEEDVEVHLC